MSAEMWIKSERGFTLIELMIAVVVVAILAAVALPAYNEQVRQTRRATAKSELAGLVQAKERFHTVNQTYVGSPCTSGSADFNAFYTVSCPAGATNTVNAFEIQAAPKAGTGQASDKCGTLVITHTGAKTITGGATGVTAAQCW